MSEDVRSSGEVEVPLSNPKKIVETLSQERGSAARREGAPSGGRRYSEAERQELLEALQSSGLSVEAFAEQRGMSMHTLYAWRRRAARDAGEQPRGKKRARTKRYTPEQRRAAVEAYYRSGRTRTEFAALWGLSLGTLSKWINRYESEGPRGLEPRHRPGPGRPRTIPASVRAEIVRTKERHPLFGMRRVRDFLARFRGVRVSAGTVQKTLKENGVADGPARKKPRRKPKPPRRFERARPMQLWQSDITSYLLTRHSRRVYLTVFLDDRSRYVAGWSLASHQKGELVTDCLFEALARFGKPAEVLTDQGRQYFSWRGRSAFQKLLDKEGIRHVVSRTHHPQTLGKCERLWKTVGEEFWERTKPQDLVEARERLGHWFSHYNHFRPHQGIDGLVPADVFFGAEPALRETLEKELSANELALALEEAPRRSLYLFGQVGDRHVALHGERGRVVVHSDQGELVSLSMDEMGVEKTGGDEDDERRGTETEEDLPQADELHGAAASGAAGARAVGERERGGAEDRARLVHGDPGVLAGQGLEERGGDAAGSAAAAGVADVAAGSERHAGGSFAPAEDARQSLAPSSAAGGGPGAPEEGDRGAGEEARTHRGPGAGAEGPALEPGEREPERGGDGCAKQAPSNAPCESSPVTEDAAWGAGFR